MFRAVMIKKKQEAEDTMIKIIGCMLVIIGCGAIGFFEAEKMKKRLLEMQYIKRYVLFMKGEIRYGNKTLPETFLQLEKRANGVWKDFFGRTGKKLWNTSNGTLSYVWEEEVENSLSSSLLREAEKKEWKELGENLGYLDQEMQINLLEIYEQHLGESIEKEKEKMSTQTKLYQVLGVMSGIFLVIILV